MKGDTIQYIYTNSMHNDPLCRMVPIAIGNAQAESIRSSQTSLQSRDVSTINCERKISKDLTFIIFTIAIK
jgi:hypothetical protein